MCLFGSAINFYGGPGEASHKSFVKAPGKKTFDTSDMKPTYGSVRLTDNSMVTVPVFDMKAMILSILHDKELMREENFAPGLDIFTGDVDPSCEANQVYGEIHTGDRWKHAVS